MKCIQTGSTNRHFKLDQVGIEVARPDVLCSDCASHSGSVTKAYVSRLLARQIAVLPGVGEGCGFVLSLSWLRDRAWADVFFSCQASC